MNYKIISDTCCDHPELVSFDWLTRIALYVNLGDQTFTDDGTLDPSMLLDEISRSDAVPKSACPSPGAFEEMYHGPEQDIYVVTISKELSGTYNSAVQGAELFLEENPNKNIHVFNSKNACSGQVLICHKLKELVDSGLPFDEVVRQTEAFIDTVETMFVLEDLEILRKSGRMSKLQSAVVGAVKLKLVMGKAADGTIKKVTAAFSMNQALSRMTNIISQHAQRVGDGKIECLVITHCFAKERAEYFAEKLKETCDIAETILCKASGVTAMYANRGGIVVSYA